MSIYREKSDITIYFALNQYLSLLINYGWNVISNIGTFR